MDTPNTPHEPRESTDLSTRIGTWLELKREMESLYAQIEYVKLLLKLGVGQR